MLIKLLLGSMKARLAFIIFFVQLIITYPSSGQNLIVHDTISFNVKDRPISEILQIIHQKTGARFSYSPEIISAERRISMSVNKLSLEEVLNQLGEQSGLNFNWVRGQWVITKRNLPSDGSIKNNDINQTVRGTVRDDSSGESLIGAAIYIPDLEEGTITNNYGFYSLTLPRGNYRINISFIGYETQQFILKAGSNETLNVNLKPAPSLMTEVIVKPDAAVENLDFPQMNVEKLRPAEADKMPALLGEGDIIKSLQMFPGIKLYSDGSSYFFVRGGERDQNLIMIDDAPVYNPSHLLGLFTTFIPDAVKDIKIYKGDFPASLGGRLSSIIDINTNDGNMNNYVVKGSLGLISEQLSVEGPLSKGKSSFFISGRRSHLQWILHKLNPSISDFYFDDINSKFNIRMNGNNRLFVSFYTGTDNYSDTNAGIKWKNIAGTLRWNHIFNDKLFSNTTLYGSRYDYFLNTAPNAYWTSQIANLSLKTDFSWFINPSNTFGFGFNFSGHNFNPGNFYIDGNLNPGVPYVSQKHARSLALYAEEEQKLGTRWFIRYGLRLSSWQNTGQTIEYKFDASYNPTDTLYYNPGELYHSYAELEPRLSVRYRLSDNSVLKTSYARTVQYMQVISNSISPFTSLDVWLPAGPNIAPQYANQVSAGFFEHFSRLKSEFSFELYYRHMGNQIDYIDHAKMILNPLLETQLRFGSASAYGAELILKRNLGKLQGWISYNWSRVLKTTPEINNGKPYPPYYDRPNQITAYLDLILNDRANFTADWIYSTGSAFTSPSSYYNYNGNIVPLYLAKDNSRLPSYHRLDVSLLFRLNKKPHKFNHSLIINIFNVYGRQNPVYVNFNKIVDSDGKIVTPRNLMNSENRVVTKTYIYNVIPSITYKFSVE